MMMNEADVKAALDQEPGRFLLKELRHPYGPIKGGDYCSLRGPKGNEIMAIEGAVLERLARAGVVKAQPYNGEGSHRFDLIAA
jgi:hypothetical protein